MTHRSPLAWLHFGDLHVTTVSAPNHQDLAALVDEANRGLAGALDFALLPGDSAENGTEAQFRLVRAATGRLALPLRIVPGDHDAEPGSLAAFHVALGAPALPFAERRPGTRCLFLDIVSGGTADPTSGSTTPPSTGSRANSRRPTARPRPPPSSCMPIPPISGPAARR